jgi:hypothetical protein
MAEVHYHTNSQDWVSEKPCRENDVGPTCGFIAFAEVGPGATVDFLQTGYPHIHASGQDKRQSMHPHAATWHRDTGTRLPA